MSAAWAAPPKSALAGAPVPFAHGLLWKVQRAGSAPSYVFGTVHSEDARILELPAPVREALDRTRSLTLEVDLDAGALQRVSEAMYYRDGRDLESVIGASLYRDCVHLMATYGVSEERLHAMKPWVVVATLSRPPPQRGAFLDLALYRRAVEAGKTVYGLERIDEQIHYFDDMTLADQVALLRDTVRHHADMPRMFDEILRAYLARDLGELMAINTRYLRLGDPALARRFTTRFVTRRNRLMVERMQPRLVEGGAFIAVGALHLPGDEGILQLLARRGYRVESVY
ncbi:MAG TPA: TraB/GumN family protein [Gammaproteobacteria bacterium]|nr:TraB/GumN family protein [Gammaproteobacteria bacterium]